LRWEELLFSVLADIKRLGSSLGEPDLLHANSQEAALLGACVATALHVPLVVTYHEQSPELEAFGWGRSRIATSYLPIDAIIAGSEFYRQKALVFGACPDRVHVVRHGIDIQKFAAAHQGDRVAARRHGVWRSLELASSAFVVACAARLTPRKGLEYLISASVEARCQIPDLVTVIAGTASSSSRSYADQLYEQIRLASADGFIHILETLSPDDMPTFFAGADIAVQPSLAEGLGLAIIEAMAAGVPVVASDIPGINEIVRPDVDGLLVPPKSSLALRTRMVALYENPDLRERLGSAAYERAEDAFDIERMIDETLAVYSHVKS
jgi:glycosyltransferase involved in cell wall biosynthesis